MGVAVGLSGCRARGGSPSSVDGRTPTSTARDAPGPEVSAAEAALRAGRADEAERILDAAGGVDPAAPERSWLWIDVGVARARTEEVRAVVDALPDGDMATVLRAHARRDPEDRRERVRGIRSGPAYPWACLERASAWIDELREAEAARREADEAIRTGPRFVRREACLLRARDAIEGKRTTEAAAFASRAAAEDPGDPRAPAWAARAAMRAGALDDAAIHAMTALRLQPTGARSARRLADLVRDGLSPSTEARLRAAVRGLVERAPSAEGLALAGTLEERAGASASAIDRYRTALRLGCDPVPVDRHLRRLLFAAGAWREALARLMDAVPPEARAEVGNLREPAWRRLDAVIAALSDGPSDDAGRLRLADALAEIGAPDDAVAVLGGTTSAAAIARRTSLERVVRFEDAVRGLVEAGYRAPARGASPPGLEQVLRQISAAAAEHLVADEAAALGHLGVGVRRVPLLGAWLDHGAQTTSPLVAWFRRHGKYLMLGQREGKPTEAIVLSMASLAPARPLVTQGRSFRHDVMIGFDRTVRGYVDFQGGALSGAALPDGVWLDADATRREDHAVRVAVRGIDPVLGARLDRVAAAPPAPDSIDGVLALDDPAGLWLRLARRYVRDVGPAPWGSLDVLRAHEFGHVIDLARHLPLVRGLPATIGLLASQGFSLDRVEARLEGRAQLGAVVDAARPDLAWMDLVAPLPVLERSAEAHDRGYRDVVVAALRVLARDEAGFPTIDRRRKLLPQLDRLSPDDLRRLGRAVADTGFDAVR